MVNPPRAMKALTALLVALLGLARAWVVPPTSRSTLPRIYCRHRGRPLSTHGEGTGGHSHGLPREHGKHGRDLQTLVHTITEVLSGEGMSGASAEERETLTAALRRLRLSPRAPIEAWDATRRPLCITLAESGAQWVARMHVLPPGEAVLATCMTPGEQSATRCVRGSLVAVERVLEPSKGPVSVHKDGARDGDEDGGWCACFGQEACVRTGCEWRLTGAPDTTGAGGTQKARVVEGALTWEQKFRGPAASTTDASEQRVFLHRTSATGTTHSFDLMAERGDAASNACTVLLEVSWRPQRGLSDTSNPSSPLTRRCAESATHTDTFGGTALMSSPTPAAPTATTTTLGESARHRLAGHLMTLMTTLGSSSLGSGGVSQHLQASLDADVDGTIDSSAALSGSAAQPPKLSKSSFGGLDEDVTACNEAFTQPFVAAEGSFKRQKSETPAATTPTPHTPPQPPPVLDISTKASFQKRMLALGVAGLEKELEDIRRRVWLPLASPSQLLKDLGVRPITGLLLHGPPGNGKSTVARALAQALSPRPPTMISAPEVVEPLLGASEANIRRIFEDSSLSAAGSDPVSALHIIVIDELDAIAARRTDGRGEGPRVANSVVNQLLAKIDRLSSDEAAPPFLVIGLTNRRDLIDESLLRPGRLEVQVFMGTPDARSRSAILKYHCAAMRSSGRLHTAMAPEDYAAWLREFSRDALEGFSGAEVAGLVRSAAARALVRAHASAEEAGTWGDERSAEGEGAMANCEVTTDDFEASLDEVRAGAARPAARTVSIAAINSRLGTDQHTCAGVRGNDDDRNGARDDDANNLELEGGRVASSTALPPTSPRSAGIRNAMLGLGSMAAAAGAQPDKELTPDEEAAEDVLRRKAATGWKHW